MDGAGGWRTSRGWTDFDQTYGTVDWAQDGAPNFHAESYRNTSLSDVSQNAERMSDLCAHVTWDQGSRQTTSPGISVQRTVEGLLTFLAVVAAPEIAAACAGNLPMCAYVVGDGTVGFYGYGSLMGTPGGAAAAGGYGAGKALPGCGNSFSPDTNVLMDDGSAKPISEVEIGDRVRATDVATGQTGPGIVSALHVDEDTRLADVSVTTADGQVAVVHTTHDHQFWSETRHAWVSAGSLAEDEHLATVAGRPTVPVLSGVRVFAGHRGMHDLTVEGAHTYYVLAGETPILVHNCPAAASGGDAAVDTIRMRHYTNTRGAAGITKDNVIRASDQNKVFMERARGRPLSRADAEEQYGIDQGRGRKVIEFDVPRDSVTERWNERLKIKEWVADGDLPITNVRVVR